MTIARECLNKDKLTDCSQNALSSVISKHSLVKDAVNFTEELRMSLPQDSHVSPSQLPENEKENVTTETFGLKQSNVFAEYDPDMHSWRTYQISLLTNTLEPYSETWPKHGMIANGVLSELTMSEHPIGERDCGYLLPTPVSSDADCGAIISKDDTFVMKKSGLIRKINRHGTDGSVGLARLIKLKTMWRTPDTCSGGTASEEMLDYLAENKLKRPSGMHHSLRLQDQVREKKLWPTPRNRMTGDVTPNRATDKFNNLESVLARTIWPTPTVAEANKIPNKANYGQVGLSNHPRIRGLPDRNKATKSRNGEKMTWPTPRAGNPGSRPNQKGGKILSEEVKNWRTPNNTDWKNRGTKEYREGRQIQLQTQVEGQLNPDWVEWLMGWPISWTSLEPITELMWLDWSVDPADGEVPDKLPTPQNSDHITKKTSKNWKNKNSINYCLSNPELNIQKGFGLIPRIATGIKDRVNRLKAIGNGQVPQCMAMAWNLLRNT